MSQGNISIHQLYLSSPGSQDLLGFHTALPFHLSLQMTEEKDIKFDIMAPKENRKKMVVKRYQTLAALMRQRKAKSYQLSASLDLFFDFENVTFMFFWLHYSALTCQWIQLQWISDDQSLSHCFLRQTGKQEIGNVFLP